MLVVPTIVMNGLGLGVMLLGYELFHFKCYVIVMVLVPCKNID